MTFFFNLGRKELGSRPSYQSLVYIEPSDL